MSSSRPTRPLRSWRRWLAGAAGLAGVLAPFAAAPARPTTPSSSSAGATSSSSAPAAPALVDVAALAREVEAETDHISAVTLAAWLVARRPGLRVLDVRSADEYAAFHIPGAEHLPLERLAFASFAPDETLVVYSEAGAHGAQAWVFLRALGHRRVLFLRRGLLEWLDDVMSPTLPADASPAALAAFARVEMLSRHFGGAPRRLSATTPAPAPALPRGRGC